VENLIAQFYEAIKLGKNDHLEQIIHEDFTLICPTQDHVLSGVYRGKERFFGTVLPHVFGCVESSDIVFCKEHRVLCASGSVVVAIATNDGFARRGDAPYNQVYLHIFNIQDGQIHSLIEAFDTALANRALWGDSDDLQADHDFSMDELIARGF